MTNQNDSGLINRVANSGLITIKLEDHFPGQTIVPFDIKEFLFQGLILKEKDFRTALKSMDWSKYAGDILAVFCSTDAIIPQWAYMLIATTASEHFTDVRNAFPDEILKQLILENIRHNIDFSSMEGQRVVVKGCGDKPVPAAAYLEVARLLQPYAQSIMYGEPCSTVPIYKRPRKL